MLWVLVLIMVKSDTPTMLQVEHTSLARCLESGKHIEEKINKEYEERLGPPTIIWGCVRK